MSARGGEPKSLLARAIALLARREHSRAELARKLRRHLAPDASSSDATSEIDAVLDQLESSKLLSDERFAGALTTARARRYGDARVKFDLRHAGVRDDAASAALAGLAGTEFGRARALWLRRFGAVPTSAAERARQGRYLQARGFSHDTIQRLLRGVGEDD